ncbi:hypothetical protein WDZ92_52325, partial [Nostoc sp. NIES-2111]
MSENVRCEEPEDHPLSIREFAIRDDNMRLTHGILTGACFLVLATEAFAADLPARSDAPPPPAPAVGSVPALGFLSEVRIGAMAHDPWSPEKDGVVDLNAELLTVKPFH